jgi:PDZ domain
MKRNLVWIAQILAVVAAVAVVRHDHRAVAQEASANGSAEADAGAGQADQSASQSGESAADQSQADTSAQSQASGEAATQTESDAGSQSQANGTTQDTADQSAATSQNQATDASAGSQADATADAQQDREAGPSQDPAGLNQGGERQELQSQRQQSRQTDAGSRTNLDARGRTDLDAQRGQRRQGRTDLDARGRASLDAQGRQGRADFDAQGRQRRAGRDARGQTDFDAHGQARFDSRSRTNLRQRDVTAGIEFGQATDRGLTINTLERNSVFFDSGLRRGDVIISYNGRPIHSHADFQRLVVYEPGQRVPVVVLRDGQQETIFVTYQDNAQFQGDALAGQQAAPGYLGVVFDARIPNAAVLTSVKPGSPAQEAGLQPGDDILALNGQEIRSFQEAVDMIGSMQAGEELVIDFAYQSERSARPIDERTVAVLDARPMQDQRIGARRELRGYRGPQYGTPQFEAVPRQFDDDREFRQGDVDRERGLLDRDNDGRLLDRDDNTRNQGDNRGLIPRILD